MSAHPVPDGDHGLLALAEDPAGLLSATGTPAYLAFECPSSRASPGIRRPRTLGEFPRILKARTGFGSAGA